MKELLNEIDKRFAEALDSQEETMFYSHEIIAIHSKIKEEVFLEYLDKFIGK